LKARIILNFSLIVSKIKTLELSELVSVFPEFAKLKKTGNRGEHKMLCPFHKEKTASFFFNEKKKAFHCFGCGIDGTIFDYSMRRYGSVLTAVVKMANFFKIKIKWGNRTADKFFDEMHIAASRRKRRKKKK
jgi:DNA primase